MSERLNINEFRVFREYLREACGLYFSDDKYSRVAKALDSRMAELGIGCFSEYERMLTSSPGSKDELVTLATLLTIGETHFFRNRDHWRAFADCVLPWILERNAATNDRRIRIWCAGCSTGEEAYTTSIVLSRSLPDFAHWSIEIIGTDISPAAIVAAKRAVYTENSFRGVPPEIKKEYFEQVKPGRYRPRADIREMVRFQEMNLLDTEAAAQMCNVDIIFCRNVLIYFDASGIERVMKHFRRSLKPDGYLFLGHAEMRHGSSSGFASLNVCDTFIYKSVPCAASCFPSFPIPQHIEDQPSSTVTPKSPTKTSRPGGKGPRKVVKRRHTAKPARDVRQRTPTPGSIDLHRTQQPRKPATPAAKAPPVPPCLNDLRLRAIEYLCEEENAKARKTFEEILRWEPDDPESLVGMALLSADSGSSEAAIEYCEQALGVQPMYAEAYCVLALVHEGLGEDTTAQRELEKAVYLDDGFAIAHFHLAGIHNRARRQDAAMREFNNTLKVLSDDDERRVRLYSGGFIKETIAQICEQRLGIEAATAGNINVSNAVGNSQEIEGMWK